MPKYRRHVADNNIYQQAGRAGPTSGGSKSAKWVGERSR
jgi:hypothetical protein